jgi:hypothetical protein
MRKQKLNAVVLALCLGFTLGCGPKTEKTERALTPEAAEQKLNAAGVVFQRDPSYIPAGGELDFENYPQSNNAIICPRIDQIPHTETVKYALYLYTQAVYQSFAADNQWQAVMGFKVNCAEGLLAAL